MISFLPQDIRAKAKWCYGSTSSGAILKALLTDGTFAMVVYRLMQASGRMGLAPLAMVFNKLNAVFGQCIIGRGAEFGPAFVLIHSQGVVINGAVRGGRDIFVEHQVTIGAEGRQSPVLGDRIFLGAGAKVLGPVTIGSGARIGANAVVVHDVAADTTVVGIPARPILRRGDQASGVNAPDDSSRNQSA